VTRMSGASAHRDRRQATGDRRLSGRLPATVTEAQHDGRACICCGGEALPRRHALVEEPALMDTLSRTSMVWAGSPLFEASARVNVGSRGSLSLSACSSASGTWQAGLNCVPGRMMIVWARLYGASGRRTNTVIAPRFAPTLFVCSSTYRMTIRRRGTSFVDCGMSASRGFGKRSWSESLMSRFGGLRSSERVPKKACPCGRTI